MNTVIKINGLDVEFSEQVPTVAGARWGKTDKGRILLYDVALNQLGELVCWYGGCEVSLSRPGFIWSTSPLVPAVEVERAWEEGFSTGSNVGSELGDWRTSRARRVTEGGE